MVSSVRESGNNVRGLRSLRIELDESIDKDLSFYFPDDRDLNLDLSGMDAVEFWISHFNLYNVDQNNIELRLKTAGNNFYHVDIDFQSSNWIKHSYRRAEFSTSGSPDWADINTVEIFIPALASGNRRVNDDFEGAFPGVWTRTHNVTNINIDKSTNYYRSAGNSILFDHDGTTTNGWIQENWTGTPYTTGEILTSFWIYIDDITTGSYFECMMGDKSNGTATIEDFRFSYDSGSSDVLIERRTGVATWAEVGNINLDTWYRVMISLDLDADTYSIYIHNEWNVEILRAENYGVYQTGLDYDDIWFLSRLGGSGHEVYIDDVWVSDSAVFGQIQFDGFVMRKLEVHAVAENIESKKLWGIRDLPLLDKDVLEEDTAQALVDTILEYSQYPTIRSNGTTPFIMDDLIGKTIEIESKGMKWTLPVTSVKATLDSKNNSMIFALGRKVPDLQEILEGFGIEQGRITIGGSGIDWGVALDQFDKACFQTCEVGCQECVFGYTCESSCQNTGCLTECEITLCMNSCQTIKDRYENFCSPGAGCQTCVESPAGPII